MRLELQLEPPQQRISHYTFDEHGGYIGSDPECHWVLEGIGRPIARRLALISFDEELFWLSDDSPDGILHNESRVPIGKGNRVPVKDGDSFYMAGLQVVARLPGQTWQDDVLISAAAAAAPDTKCEAVVSAIPDDWMDVPPPSQTERCDFPALVTARRLSSMQEAASKALLQQLLPNAARPRDDIDVEGAAILGKALRVCIDVMFQLSDEYSRVERTLTGPAMAAEQDSAISRSTDFCQRMMSESQRESALEELLALAQALPGNHSALRQSASDALTATLGLYQPAAIEQRFDNVCKAPRPQSGVTVSFGDRLVRNSGLWKFYAAWQRQLQTQETQRPDRRVFDKALLTAFRQRRHAGATPGAKQHGDAS